MFGSMHKLLPGVVLVLLCAYLVRLYVTKDIYLYIHPRYALFALIMAIIGGVLLCAGFVWNRMQIKPTRLSFVDWIVVSVTILAFAVAPQALSSNVMQRKTLSTPTANTSSSKNVHTCPEVTATMPIEQWVFFISEYGADCYRGQQIHIRGFVMERPDNPLPNDMFYLGRVVVSCCVIDARPYALPISAGQSHNYTQDTWLELTGTLELTKIRGVEQLTVVPATTTVIPNPNLPYEYLNSPDFTTIEPLQRYSD